MKACWCSDALESEAIARARRRLPRSSSSRFAISCPRRFHDPFSRNLAYGDVFKIGHDNYRAGLLDQMQRGNLGGDEQRTRMPNATCHDRMTFYLGGKEIQVLYFGNAHTKGDSILFVFCRTGSST